MTRKAFSVALGAGAAAALGCAACGAGTGTASGTGTAPATSTTSTTSTATAANAPATKAATGSRLIAAQPSRTNYDAPYVDSLVRGDGTVAAQANVPSDIQITGPFGSGFFATHGSTTGVTLSSIDSAGHVTDLATIPSALFISAGGAPDGSEWMILERGNNSGCGPGTSGRPEVYVQRPGAAARRIATLPDDSPYQVYAWTSRGVVLQEGNQGCVDLTVPANTLPTVFVDPATGAISPQPADCFVQAVSVDGTIACTAALSSGPRPAPSDLAVRLVSRDGSHRDLARSALGMSDPLSVAGAFAFSPDGATLAFSVASTVDRSAYSARVALVDTRSGAVRAVAAPARYLAVVGWLDGTHVVAVSSPAQLHSADHDAAVHGTYVLDVSNGAPAKVSDLSAVGVSG